MSIFPPEPEELNGWDKVTAAFDTFPAPGLDVVWLRDPIRTFWIFRGHKKVHYPLQPSIERAERRFNDWPKLEDMILDEFQSKARLHLNARELPPLDQHFSWLALMQHYGVPTRLLDLTYSPYVALYFALRNRSKEEQREPAAVWAFHGSAMLEEAKSIYRKSDQQQSEYDARRGVEPSRPSDQIAANILLEDIPTGRDIWRDEENSWRSAIEVALVAKGARRSCFNENGFIALPPIQNQRLSSQQGAFLFNCAEELTFQDSLHKMMNGGDDTWCRLFSIPPDKTLEFERKLFQMNIHDLSLFPDIKGLAGFIRQKARLHWLVPEWVHSPDWEHSSDE